jgi:hypothetical protein
MLNPGRYFDESGQVIFRGLQRLIYEGFAPRQNSHRITARGVTDVYRDANESSSDQARSPIASRPDWT